MKEDEVAVLVVDRQKLLLIFESIARTCGGLGNFEWDATIPMFNCGTLFCPNRQQCNSLMSDIRELLGSDKWLSAFNSGEMLWQQIIVKKY